MEEEQLDEVDMEDEQVKNSTGALRVSECVTA